MIDAETLLEAIPKTVFALALIGSYLFFGGLQGRVESTFAFGIILGFIIGREVYRSR